MWKLALILSSIVLFSTTAHADTHEAATCSYTDVSLAVTAASDGDIVSIPTGSCTWTSQLSISKSITVRGSGSSNTVITDNYNGAIIKMTGALEKSWRITGIKFLAVYSDFNGVINVSGYSKSWRIDNNKFENLGDSFGIATSSITYGVIDHNEFINTTSSPFTGVYVGGGSSTSEKEAQWSLDTNLGTGDAVYIEDNTFTHTGGTAQSATFDTKDSARVVYRYNTSRDWVPHAHGTGSNNWGVRLLEVYNNTIQITTGKSIGRGMFVRGGTGVFYNNKFVGPGTFDEFFVLTDYRTCCGTFSGSTCGAVGDYTKRCDGDCVTCFAGYGDNNISDQGWLCYHQVGAGKNNQSEPVYEWNNCTSASDDCTPSSSNAHFSVSGLSGSCINPSVSDHIKENRDYYNNTQKPGYTAYTYPHPLASGLFSIGGTVSGLTGTVVLQNNGGDNKTITANGTYSFLTSMATGSTYSVTVSSQPANQTCSASNGSGTVGSSNVTNVNVTCYTNVVSTDTKHLQGGSFQGGRMR